MNVKHEHMKHEEKAGRPLIFHVFMFPLLYRIVTRSISIRMTDTGCVVADTGCVAAAGTGGTSACLFAQTNSPSTRAAATRASWASLRSCCTSRVFVSAVSDNWRTVLFR